MNKFYLLGKLTPYGKQKKLIVSDQAVPDIMTAMLNAHKIYAHEYDKISTDFFDGDGISSAKKIFDYLKKNVKYQIESDKNQRIMSPSAIISLGQNDCKNYALFIVGVLDSLKRKGLIKNRVFYRFASYKLLDEIPHHTFAVIVDNKGNEIFVDPVLDFFNERKIYYHKIDKYPQMAMYSVSGIGGKKKAATKAAAQPNANPKGSPLVDNSVTASIPVTTTTASSKKPKKIILKISLAPARGSFLLLIGLNFLGLATKLQTALLNNKQKVSDFWYNLGGNPNELIRKVEQGAKKKKLLGVDVDFTTEGQIGVVPAAAAAVTAAPILIKVAEFLQKLGIDPQEIAQAGKQILAKQVKAVVEKNLEQDKKTQQLENDQVQQVVDESFDEKSKKTNYMPVLLGGGAILLLYMFSKKSKK
jgi:hypothetical protein